MGKRLLLFAIVLMCVQNIYSATRLSILRPTSSVTHQWYYLPVGDVVTQQGLKDESYPLVINNGTKTLLRSETININGCDLGMTVRYKVSTKNTHPVNFELVDDFGNVWYSFVEESPEINTSTMTMGHVVNIGKIEGASNVSIQVSLSDATLSDEAINIIELELYSYNGLAVETGIDNIFDDAYEVSVSRGQVNIKSEKQSEVEIYDISSRLIKTDVVCPGINEIKLPVGFYIINIDDDKIIKVSINN